MKPVYEDIFNTEKLDLLNQIIAEEYAGVSGQNGPSAFAEPIKEIQQGFPDIKWIVEDLIAEGDRAVARSKWRGIHKGTFRGFAPTQKQVNVHGIAIFQFKNGEIIRFWNEVDRL